MAHAKKKSASGAVSELPCDRDNSLLLRYIKNLPVARETRLTRQRTTQNQNEAESGYVSGSGSDGRRNSGSLKTAFDQLSTSDYSSISGSCKLSMKRRALISSVSPVSPASPISDRLLSSPNDDPLTDLEVQNTNHVWDSDESQDEGVWEREAEVTHLKRLVGSIIVKDDVRLLLPHTNLMELPPSHFSIMIHSPSILKPKDLLQIMPDTLHFTHISHVVQISPEGHGPIFQEPHCSLLFIPLTHNLCEEGKANVVCLFSSSLTNPRWRRLPPTSVKIDHTSNFLIVKTCSLGLFTVFYEDPSKIVEVSKVIRRRIGGELNVKPVPGLKINFPRGSCPEDFEAKVSVFFNFEPWHPDNIVTKYNVLACPIVKLSPSNYNFNGKSVIIELPVPRYREVIEMYPDADFKIYQSHTLLGDALAWEELDPKVVSTNKYRNGEVTVSFKVKHFTFFKTVWNKVICNLPYFVNWVAFPMKCQAYMQEVQEDKSFSLEVICFKDEELQTSRHPSIYPHIVGSSLKPKMVKPGNLLLKLNSGKFLPNTEAGEENILEKVEMDFRGSDFSKQFACVFKDIAMVDKGTFGKVIVDRVDGDMTKLENVFEFNLTKQGVETEAGPSGPTSGDAWSAVMIRELACSMGISSMWRQFADFVGVNKFEQDMISRCGSDPFIEMMIRYEARGGSPEEFVNKLWAMSRNLNVEAAIASGGGGAASLVTTPGSNTSTSGVSGSGSQNSQGQGLNPGLDTHLRRLSLFNLNPWKGGREDGSDSGTADHHLTTDGSPAPKMMNKSGLLPDVSPTGSRESRKRSIAEKPPRSLKRQRTDRPANLSRMGSYSAKNDSYSSSDESGTEETIVKKAKTISTERHKQNPHKLGDHDLWKISGEMSSINWRALGRTMGLEESTLVNLEHAHKSQGVRECAYQMMLEWKEKKPKTCTFGSLYSSLTTEKMNGVAKKLVLLLEEGNFKK